MAWKHSYIVRGVPVSYVCPLGKRIRMATLFCVPALCIPHAIFVYSLILYIPKTS